MPIVSSWLNWGAPHGCRTSPTVPGLTPSTGLPAETCATLYILPSDIGHFIPPTHPTYYPPHCTLWYYYLVRQIILWLFIPRHPQPFPKIVFSFSQHLMIIGSYHLWVGLKVLRPQRGSEGQKLSKVILKDLVEMKKMLKSASKNIIPSQRYYFLEIAICL